MSRFKQIFESFSFNHSEFKDKVVLITGASSGIGRGLALAFGEEKAKVVVNYHQNEREAERVVKQIEKTGGKAVAIQADVSNENEVEAMVRQIIKLYGSIDVLINNAGDVFEPAGWEEISAKDWEKTLAVNLTGVFNCIRLVAPLMQKQKHGKIVNIASLAGVSGYTKAPAYSAAKAGVINLTQAFAKELAPYVSVNAVAPGYVNTDWHKNKEKDFWQMVKKEVPMQRIAKIDDITNAVKFFACLKSRYITGQTLVVDGGLNI